MARGPYKAKPPAGSIAELAMLFRQSPQYRTWAESTRAKNDKVIGDFIARNGAQPLSDLTRGALLKMRDSLSATPGAANNWMKVIRAMLQYGVDLELAPVNAAASIRKLPPVNADGFRVWREDEIAAYLRRWTPETAAHRAMVLLLCTGASVSDVVKLGPGNVRAGRISYRRNKTGVEVDVPILPLLEETLRWAPVAMTFLQTDQGLVRSAPGLSNSIRRWAAEAGMGAPDKNGRLLSPHGLRKAQGRRLAEAGCSPHTIAAWLGHSGLGEVMTYTKKYDRARATDEGAERLANISDPKPTVVRLKKRGEST